MSQRNFIGIFLVIFLTVNLSSQKIPSYFKLCHRNDPHLDKCVKYSVESLKPYLRSGIPALNIPRCEPLKIRTINISQALSSVAVKAVYSNILVKGSTNFIIKKINVHINNDRIQMKLYFPQLSIISNYEMNGKILMVPIVGNGQAQGNFTEINADVIIQGSKYQDRLMKKHHFRINDVYVDFRIGHARIYFDNLFNGDKTLANGVNAFFNENWKIITADMKPVLENILADLFKDYSNKIFSKYSLDDLLPV